MIEALVEGLWLVGQWPAPGYLVLGIMIGIFFGVVPGLSGLAALAIMLPFTFTMEPASAFAFLLGMFAVTTTSDSISSILLGIPGTVASQATVLDGHPMAVQGQAGRALGAAFTCSMVGGVIGAIFLALSIPIARPLIMAFASPELLMLGVLGLTMVGVLSGNSIAKGLVAATVGLMLSLVGYATIEGIPRYTFGTTYLLDGIPLVPLVLGLFALPELLDLTRFKSISRLSREPMGSGVVAGILDTFRHWWLVLRSSLIGVYVGLLPGLGGTIADWVAYGHVVQSSRDKSRFGKGDVRGVLAPESANNAMKGSALVPVIAFGIPGSAPMAILMGALLIQGLTPGPAMLTTHLNLTFSLVWTLVIANVFASLLLLCFARRIADLTFIRGDLIFPAVSVFVLMGAWVDGNHIGNWLCLIAFGVLGYLMRLGGFPRPPLILGFILGPIMENSYFLTRQAYTVLEWTTRPIVMVLIGLILITLIMSGFGMLRSRWSGPVPATTEVTEVSPGIALILTFFAVVLSAYGLYAANGWPTGAAFFPIAIGIPALALSLIAFTLDLRQAALAVRTPTENFRRSVAAIMPSATELYPATIVLVIFIGILAGSILVGQTIALVAFVIAYLRLQAGCRWRVIVVYAVATYLVLEGLFGEVANVIWHRSLLLG